MKRCSVKRTGERSFRVGLGRAKVNVTANDRREALRLGKAEIRAQGLDVVIRNTPRRIDRTA